MDNPGIIKTGQDLNQSVGSLSSTDHNNFVPPDKINPYLQG